MKRVPGPTSLPRADSQVRAAIHRLEAATKVDTDAVNIKFDPGASGMTSTNVQDAILELWAALPP